METSLKTGFAQIFSCCPNLSCLKFWGAAAPLAPPARTPYARVCPRFYILSSLFILWKYTSLTSTVLFFLRIANYR